jgi:mevalonate kinase
MKDFSKGTFSTETFGKWILAGEHAVIRGFPALAFPLLSQSFRFSHEDTPQDLDVVFSGKKGEDYRLLFFGVLEHALGRLGLKREVLKGKVKIESSLPVGSGLGASAALCVALSRWFEAQGFIQKERIYDFSRELEDLFHGESSGVDIAVAMKAHGVHFVRGKEMKDVDVSWKPRLYLSYSGSKGLTSECVSKVKALFETKPALAQHLDQQMTESVELAEDALRKENFKDLKTALLLAGDCFEKWGLVFGDLKSHMRFLQEAGAVAVKPTGSGGGGYVLSLWEDKLSSIPENLISVF